ACGGCGLASSPRTEFGKGNRDVMHQRSIPGVGKPICAKALRARAFGRGPFQRKALWPAATVCRINRPHTWPHRPKDRASKYPCQWGAVHTWRKSDILLFARIE